MSWTNEPLACTNSRRSIICFASNNQHMPKTRDVCCGIPSSDFTLVRFCLVKNLQRRNDFWSSKLEKKPLRFRPTLYGDFSPRKKENLILEVLYVNWIRYAWQPRHTILERTENPRLPWHCHIPFRSLDPVNISLTCSDTISKYTEEWPIACKLRWAHVCRRVYFGSD